MNDQHLVPLTEHHEPAGFDCGNDQLNAWLLDHAPASQRADLARTYLVLDGDDVAGYVSLTSGSIRQEHAPKRYARGRPRHPIPTILIARLAVDLRHQRQGLGSRLLAEALRRAVAASDTAAARIVVVDALDDRAAAAPAAGDSSMGRRVLCACFARSPTFVGRFSASEELSLIHI